MADIIVAGNTSGSVTISAPLVAGSTVLTLPVIAADTLAGIAATQTLTNKTLVAPALGTPASGVLTNCTGVAKAALPAGSVLQVVSTTLATTMTTTSTSFVDTGVTATITPTSATSKILVVVNMTGGETSASAYKLLRGATALSFSTAGSVLNGTFGKYNSSNVLVNSAGFNYLDSPATTSSTIYKVQIAIDTGTGSINRRTLDTAFCFTSGITLMEIQG